MALEDRYLDAIRGFEGFTPRAQWDYKQHSVGYGSKALSPDEEIDEPTARARHAQDLASAEAQVTQAFPGVQFTPGRLAALTSLTQNAGNGWTNAGLGDAVRRGDWNDAAARFTQYDKAGGKVVPGLTSRRGQEVAWFDGNEAPIAMAMQQERKRPMDDQQPPQPALAPAAALGGPGALFGGDSQEFFSRLANAAAFGRDDPSLGVAALQRQAKNRDDFSLVQGQDGTMFRLNKHTGQVTPFGSANQKVDAGLLKSTQENFQKYGTIHDVSQRAKAFQDKIASGELDLGLASKGAAAVESLFGKSSPQTQLYNDFDAFKTQLANSQLLLNNGVQTEGDAQRAYKEFLGGASQFDNKTALRQLDNLIRKNSRVIGDAGVGLESTSKNYRGAEALKPYQDQLKGWQDFYKGYSPSSGQQPAQQQGQRPPLSSFAR